MHEHEARLGRLEASRMDAPKAGRRLALPTAALTGGPVRSGELVVRVEDLVAGYLPKPGTAGDRLMAVGDKNLFNGSCLEPSCFVLMSRN